MKVFRSLFQTVGLVALAAVLLYLPFDLLRPFVLPAVIIGIPLIFLLGYIGLKRRGTLSIFMALLLTCAMPVHAQEIVDCGGSYKEDKGAIAAMLEMAAGKDGMTAENAGAIMGGIQDNLTGGNILTSDFEDDAVLACVQRNIANLKGKVCSAEKLYDTYDPKIREDSFYIMDNFKRMSAKEASGGSWWKWATDKMGFTESDVRESYKCAKEYVENAAQVDRRNERKCNSVGTTIQNGIDECWVCDLVHLVIESVQLMAGNTYEYMRDFSLMVLGIMFLFWIAIRVLKLIGQLGYAQNSEFFTDLLMRVITVSIAAAILHTPIIDFYRIAVSPFITLTAVMSGEMSKMSMTDGTRTFAEIVETDLKINTTNVCHYCTDMLNPSFQFERSTTKQDGTSTIEVMDPQSINGLLCLTCTSYRQVLPFIAVGESMSCYANYTAFNIPWTTIYIPNFPYLIVGWLLIIAFSLLAMIVGFYLIDITIRLGFIIVLTPLLITAWAFPISREYAKRGWDMLVFCLMQYLGVSVMMAIFLNMCLQIIPGTPRALLDAMAKNDVEKLFRVITGVDSITGGAAMVVVGATASAAGSFLLLLFLIVFLFLATKMLMATEKVVSTLSGIGMNIPGMALSALTAGIKEAASLVGVSSTATKAVGSAVKSKLKSKKAGASGAGSRSASLGSFSGGAGGGSTGSGGGSGGGSGSGGSAPSGGASNVGSITSSSSGQSSTTSTATQSSTSGGTQGGNSEQSSTGGTDQVNAASAVAQSGAYPKQKQNRGVKFGVAMMKTGASWAKAGATRGVFNGPTVIAAGGVTMAVGATVAGVAKTVSGVANMTRGGVKAVGTIGKMTTNAGKRVARGASKIKTGVADTTAKMRNKTKNAPVKTPHKTVVVPANPQKKSPNSRKNKS